MLIVKHKRWLLAASPSCCRLMSMIWYKPEWQTFALVTSTCVVAANPWRFLLSTFCLEVGVLFSWLFRFEVVQKFRILAPPALCNQFAGWHSPWGNRQGSVHLGRNSATQGTCLLESPELCSLHTASKVYCFWSNTIRSSNQPRTQFSISGVRHSLRS